MNIVEQLAKEFNIKNSQVEAVINLIDDGNSIPFISRYRKEVTGSLNDEILRNLDARIKYLRNLDEKKQTVIQTISELGKITPELLEKIDSVLTLVELEDIYRPYKPKKRTKASVARENGLEPIAKMIFNGQIEKLEKESENFINENYDSVKKVIDGAKDIVAEDISDNAEIRKYIRRQLILTGQIVSVGKGEEKGIYSNYYKFSDNVRSIQGYKILAINRGEKEKQLTVNIEVDNIGIIENIYRRYVKNGDNIYLKEAITDSYKRLIFPSVEREIRNELTANAQESAIEVFKTNLNQLLMQPPIEGKTVLGWDPAFRTGCKLAVVSSTGKVLKTLVIYPLQPHNKVEEAKLTLKKLVDSYSIELISLGNGTASRESEQIICEFIREFAPNISYVVVNEAGASVYSASKYATEEFPDLSEGARSAVSIARRLQDPLAELVKIDPKSIGVGQYQHDMNKKNLEQALDGVFEDCVNKVGADLNTASVALLKNISGLTQAVCKNIIEYRDQVGSFKNRVELLKVSKLGPKMFEQCAGFLRINNGDEPLDKTSVHPENYKNTYEILSRFGHTKEELLKNKSIKIDKNINIKELANYLGIGEITIKDILKELEKPSRDPRQEMPKPILRSDVISIDDVKEGMILKGTVRNVTDFGAFIDIGVHADGMVHISKISKRYIKHPKEVLKVGDIVDVEIIGIDKGLKRISLSMLNITSKKGKF